MNKKVKAVHIALFVSVAAVVISTINLLINGLNTMQVTIFVCMIAILVANLVSYTTLKKKDKDSEK